MVRSGLVGGVLVGLTTTMVLVGCSTTIGFPIMDRSQTDEDKLPVTVEEFLDSEEFDFSSSRLSASKDDNAFFLVYQTAGQGKGTPCLVVVGPSSSSTCGGLPLTFTPVRGDAVQLVGAPASGDGGWTVLSENIRVRSTAG